MVFPKNVKNKLSNKGFQCRDMGWWWTIYQLLWNFWIKRHMPIHVKHHLHFRNGFINSFSAIIPEQFTCLAYAEKFPFIVGLRYLAARRNTSTQLPSFFSFLNDCHEELSPDSETPAKHLQGHLHSRPYLHFRCGKTNRFRVVTCMLL
jgi:hypothetical protein